MTKKAKKRTENHFRNSVISCMRTNFARYSPKYQEVMLKSRVEIEKINKDGKASIKPEVWYKCNICAKNTKQKDINIDHLSPVIEIGKSNSDYNLEQIFQRIDCEVDNLQVLCENCHDEKSKAENALRLQCKAAEKMKNPASFKTVADFRKNLKILGLSQDDYVYNKVSKTFKEQ